MALRDGWIPIAHRRNALLGKLFHMPLVLVVGSPGSGLEARGAQLEALFRSSSSRSDVPLNGSFESTSSDEDETLLNVSVVDDTSCSVSGCFGDSHQEKTSRSRIKEAVEREITGAPENVLLVVSMSAYIKGFRYELFCRARSQGTNFIIIFCESDLEDCSRRNAELSAADSADRGDLVWDDAVLRDLHQRMEVPTTRNKWERTIFSIPPDEPPLFREDHRGVLGDDRTQLAGESASVQEDSDAVGDPSADHSDGASLLGKRILATLRGTPMTTKQNAATATQLPVAANFLHELDSRTNDIVAAIVRETQNGSARTLLPGRLPHLSENASPLRLPARQITLAELRRRKRMFVQDYRRAPIPLETLGDTFVDFLNDQLD